MLIAIIPLIIAVVGLLMYALCANPKLADIGRIMFCCGMFVITWVLARVTMHIG
jgi:hypothetical protein